MNLPCNKRFSVVHVLSVKVTAVPHLEEHRSATSLEILIPGYQVTTSLLSFPERTEEKFHSGN